MILLIGCVSLAVLGVITVLNYNAADQIAQSSVIVIDGTFAAMLVGNGAPWYVGLLLGFSFLIGIIACSAAAIIAKKKEINSNFAICQDKNDVA